MVRWNCLAGESNCRKSAQLARDGVGESKLKESWVLLQSLRARGELVFSFYFFNNKKHYDKYNYFLPFCGGSSCWRIQLGSKSTTVL